MFLLLFYAIPSQAIVCMGNPKVVRFSALERTVHELPANGILKINGGVDRPEILDVFQGRGVPFNDLIFDTDVIRDQDDRNGFLKWLRPRELRPNEYSMNISLKDHRITNILGSKGAQIRVNVRIKIRDEVKTAEILFNSNLSYNCQPH